MSRTQILSRIKDQLRGGSQNEMIFSFDSKFELLKNNSLVEITPDQTKEYPGAEIFHFYLTGQQPEMTKNKKTIVLQVDNFEIAARIKLLIARNHMTPEAFKALRPAELPSTEVSTVAGKEKVIICSRSKDIPSIIHLIHYKIPTDPNLTDSKHV